MNAAFNVCIILLNYSATVIAYSVRVVYYPIFILHLVIFNFIYQDFAGGRLALLSYSHCNLSRGFFGELFYLFIWVEAIS